MSALRGVRIQRNKPEMEPIIQSPSSASDEEEMWNKGFAANGHIPNSTSSVASKPKTSNSKPKTMGPKSKMEKQNNYEEYDDIQMALALSMDPKQQKNKDNEQLQLAIEKSKEDLAKQGNTAKDKKSNTTKTDNAQHKKPTDKSNRPFNGRPENWVDDEGISSDDEKLSNLKKKSNSSNKDSSKKAAPVAASKSKKRSRALSDSSSEDEKKTNVKETKPPAKKTYSRTAQKSKQQSKRPKYKEVSTDADDDSEDEVVPNRISKPNPILSNKDFQPAPKTSLSKKKKAKESDKESDGEYDPEKDSEARKSSRKTKSNDSDDSPLEVVSESRSTRAGRGKSSKPSMGKHPIPNEQILTYVGSKRTLLYISCIAKQIVDSQRMRLFVDMYANKNLDIDKSHPLHEMAPSDFYIDDGEIDKKLEELLEKPIEDGKAILTENGKYPFDDDIKKKFLRFVLIPECIIHPLKKQFSMGDQVAEEFYLQSGSRS